MSAEPDHSNFSPRGAELRAVPRVGFDVPVWVHSSELPGPLSARSRDLGIGGVCVATATRFALRSVRRVVIQLADGMLELEAEARWQQEAPGEGALLTGIAFLDPGPEALDRLWNAVIERGRDVARFLCSRSDLADFGIEEAMGMAQVTRLRDVPTGGWIYHQGKSVPGEDSIFLVASGSVVLQCRVRDAREVPVDRLEAGRLFGGLPLLAGTPPAESAVAATNACLLEIDGAAFHYLERARPWLAERIAHAVVRIHASRLHGMLLRAAHRL